MLTFGLLKVDLELNPTLNLSTMPSPSVSPNFSQHALPVVSPRSLLVLTALRNASCVRGPSVLCSPAPSRPNSQEVAILSVCGGPSARSPEAVFVDGSGGLHVVVLTSLAGRSLPSTMERRDENMKRSIALKKQFGDVCDEL
uniref:Protein-serine/threonine phosphatase n=1 Tax=Steinernema glaseri TaxID=37863 RepID=A0A1I8ATZ1_9BILA